MDHLLTIDSYKVIAPQKKLVLFPWRDLYEYRELLFFLTWRDIKVRYKEALLGIAWAIIQPLLTLLIFMFLFKPLFTGEKELSYPLFALSGLIPWLFFSTSFSFTSTSLLLDANLIKKSYFPLLTLPLSKVLAAAFDFFVASLLLLIFSFFYPLEFTWHLLFFPLWIVFAVITTLGPSLLFTSLTTLYKDVRHTQNFVLQIWMLGSPIAYSLDWMDNHFSLLLFSLNPLVAVIELFRWTLLNQPIYSIPAIAISMTSAFCFFFLGLRFFRKNEERFVDVI